MVRKETYLRILGILFICSSFSFFLLWDMQKHLKSSTELATTKNDFFLQEMNSKIELTKEHILAFKNLFSNIKSELQKFYFDSSDSIKLQTALNDGIVLPFGYAGNGSPAQGFSGFDAQ